MARECCAKVTPSQLHCSVCHQTFGAERSFKAHRVGPLGSRRCLTGPELVDQLGLEQRPNGVWRMPAPATGNYGQEAE